MNQDIKVILIKKKRFEHNREYFPLNVDEIIDNETGKTYDCDLTDEEVDKIKQDLGCD